jgi:hypothetical protein
MSVPHWTLYLWAYLFQLQYKVVKVLLRCIKHHDKVKYQEMEVYFHTLLTLVLKYNLNC